MMKPLIGKGLQYLTASVDADNEWFDGCKSYVLRVPAKPPAKDFWSVTVYDALTRSQIVTDTLNPSVGSFTNMDPYDDGSVDIYFGQVAPKGREKNFIKTDPAKGFFLVFRFYGPLEGYIDKTWRLNDLEPTSQ